ncbi:hypothetical protein [Nocardiopsis halotolerans]|uniref:hypothetical protein n=1 Tax=Nocardiopsis halotolerans TaxID=124252 RepID=UPI00036D6A01|nr:hypothetical protein [Nocardiopsis halotolerans]
MGKKIDLTGNRYGRLLVVEEAGRAKDGKVTWRCECQCGRETVVRGDKLRNGSVRSCGKGECHYLYGVTGEAHPTYGRKGDAHPTWKGDAITYQGAHERVRRLHGSASRHRCVDCGEPARDWSLDCAYVDDPRGEVNGYLLAYSPDPERYVARCALCHRSYDVALAGSRRAVESGRLAL